MSSGKGVTIITYNGIDGACAAAMALLKHPQADLRISSASRIGKTFAEVKSERQHPREIHVCGLGVYCDWSELLDPALKLKEKGCRIHWYCGRGYLEAMRGQFERFARAEFNKLGSNTEALCQAMGLILHPQAERFLALAEHDKGILSADHEPSAEESSWIDLLEASTASFFKYRDEEAFAASVRKLLAGEFTREDACRVEVYRKTGYKYVLYGNSTQLKALKQRIGKCARLDEPVLILGETGVGKEHVAHLLYEGSSRASGPFVALNCAIFAGNADMANSALFGHLKGAFTGALEKRDGAFLSADGGVLFLDELGELPLEIQAKFLRVLDDGLVIPLGSDKPLAEKPVSVRIIAATNRDLPRHIRQGKFRADLFHRLSTFTIEIPPLRERKEDIRAIAEHFLGDLPDTVKPMKLAAKDEALLRAYDWPGNVRQLNKVLKQAACLELPLTQVLAEQAALGALCEQDQDRQPQGFLPSTKEAIAPLDTIRRAYAARALELHANNWTATAKSLGIAPNTLRAILE